ncbi:hypothetical protein Tco_1292756 [Tanacetum coccineum]
MSIQYMKDMKQQYLDEMKKCEITIDEFKGKFNGMSIEINKKKELLQREQAANVSTHTPESSRRFNIIYDYDDDEDDYEAMADVDEIELLLHRDLSTPKISVASILEGFTDEPPLEENDDLFDLESKESKWKKILYDAPINDLMTEDKVLTLGSPLIVSIP